MAESLYEVLAPHLDLSTAKPSSPQDDQATTNYLNRLHTLSVDAVNSTEPESLEHEAQTTLRSLQALSKRSYRSIDSASVSLQHLRTNLPEIAASSQQLKAIVPSVESAASTFSNKYAKPAENPVLERRRRALRLGENVDRLSDILELPTLLASTIAAAAVTQNAAQGVGGANTAPSTASANASYASALDLYAHIKRLQRLYPASELIKSISAQAEAAMRDMTTSLITALRSHSLKLAGGMRLVGLLRRVAPELDDSNGTVPSTPSSARGPTMSSTSFSTATASEGSLGALFLVCRLANLSSMLDALDPLRELAEQETASRLASSTQSSSWAAGQQTERYLKRYIEIFREQCFAMVAMYKSIFPASLSGSTSTAESGLSVKGPSQAGRATNEMETIPPALATFTAHIVDALCSTLREFLPNVRDQGSRDSLLTQVLYCAGSLGRLGGDFGMMLALLEEDRADESGEQDASSPEWVQAMKKHRVQAGRLELLASGAGSRAEVLSPR